MSERDQSQPGIPPEPGASDEPHDVLAAEQFAMPAPEAARRTRPVELPPEPNPSDEPHDVLAAEEFAMPAPPRPPVFTPAATAPRSRASHGRTVAAVGIGFALAGLLRRRRRTRRRG